MIIFSKSSAKKYEDSRLNQIDRRLTEVFYSHSGVR